MPYSNRGRHHLRGRLFTAVLFSVFAPTHAAPVADWNYRVRPSDNIWNLKARYLKPNVAWQKLQDYNKVNDPLHLPPGMTLHIPVAWLRLEPVEAKVVSVIGGAVTKTSDSAPFLAVTQGMTVGYGAELITQANASLTLELADGSRVLMQSNSELVLDRLSEYGRTGMVDTHMRLMRGRVSTDVIPLSGNAARFTVSTPNTISSVRGTHFRVVADDVQGTARTEVVSGRVDVGNERRHVLVATGRGVATAPGASPGQPETLLPPPQASCPKEQITQLPFEFHWQALQGAAHYRVQVASTTQFEALTLDQVIDGTKVAIPDLSDGAHAIRVRGIAMDQFEGLDATCTLLVGAHPQPPLILEPQSNAKVRGTRPTFRWTENEDVISYSWELASDTGFTKLLSNESAVTGGEVRAPQALAYGRYYWRVASRDKSGKLGPYTNALPFDLIPEPASPEPGAPKHQHGEFVLSWAAGEPGQHYHIQLARKPDFTHPAVDKTLDKPELNLAKLSSGRWYARVQTIDTDGYIGPWGATQRTRIPCTACKWAAAGGGAVLLWFLL